MNFIISKARLNEASEINDMLTELIHDERKKYNSNINEKYKVEEFYESLMDNDDKIIFVARDNDIVLGYVYGFIQDNGNLYNNKVAKLDALFVKERYRGNGIARSLMKEYINWAEEKGVAYIELLVCKDNTNAISLYENEGFCIDKICLRKGL
ncbi:MAG: GNAT family N-acetyltransferase [Clostridia bacterium]|nr:GNAT family N-acetyltransferase [Clostridia bacterium]